MRIPAPAEEECSLLVEVWRDQLGLKPWDEWARHARREMARHARAAGLPVDDPARRTGRSTRASLECLAVAFWTEASAVVVEGRHQTHHDVARLRDLARQVAQAPLFAGVAAIRVLPQSTPERAHPRVYVTYRDHWQDERGARR